MLSSFHKFKNIFLTISNFDSIRILSWILENMNKDKLILYYVSTLVNYNFSLVVEHNINKF